MSAETIAHSPDILRDHPDREGDESGEDDEVVEIAEDGDEIGEEIDRAQGVPEGDDDDRFFPFRNPSSIPRAAALDSMTETMAAALSERAGSAISQRAVHDLTRRVEGEEVDCCAEESLPSAVVA